MLRARGQGRSLAARSGIDFASNDYLGLTRDPAISAVIAEAAAAGVATGSGGSRLLRGNSPEHEALEEKAARFFGVEAALFFGSGFSGNAALLSALPQRGDLIVADELIHASAHAGMRQSRADYILVAHNDADAVDDAIGAWRSKGGVGTPWIAVESIYSMDGDLAPLADLMAIAARHDGVLVVDEAHSTGVFGPGGRGLAAPFEGAGNLIVLHTCGKALGVEGALVTGPAAVKDYLVNRAREFIYSTAPSPLIAVAVSAALDRIATADDLRTRLCDLQFRAGTAISARLGLRAPQSPILPVILGGDARAVAVAITLQKAGFDIRAIRPPSVPAGTARLRVTITLNATGADIDALGPELEAAIERHP